MHDGLVFDVVTVMSILGVSILFGEAFQPEYLWKVLKRRRDIEKDLENNECYLT